MLREVVPKQREQGVSIVGWEKWYGWKWGGGAARLSSRLRHLKLLVMEVQW